MYALTRAFSTFLAEITLAQKRFGASFREARFPAVPKRGNIQRLSKECNCRIRFTSESASPGAFGVIVNDAPLVHFLISSFTWIPSLGRKVIEASGVTL